MSIVTRCVSSLQICRWKLSEALIKTKFSNVQPLRDVYRFTRVVSTPSLLLRQVSVSPYLNTVKPSVETEKKSVESQETKSKDDGNPTDDPVAKPSLFQRFKQMSKDYWYVLIPVHIITSAGWFGGFYFAVKRYSTLVVFLYISINVVCCISGLDVVALLENLGVSEKIINPLRGSSAGYVALAYAMYKVATPARYTVTLGKFQY